jgi:putative addiction module CopG family antidote
MTLKLSDDLQSIIESRCRSGRYDSPESLVRAALHALEQDERRSEFEAGEWDRLLAEGEESGPGLEGESVLAELRRLRSGPPSA